MVKDRPSRTQRSAGMFLLFALAVALLSATFGSVHTSTASAATAELSKAANPSIAAPASRSAAKKMTKAREKRAARKACRKATSFKRAEFTSKRLKKRALAVCVRRTIAQKNRGKKKKNQIPSPAQLPAPTPTPTPTTTTVPPVPIPSQPATIEPTPTATEEESTVNDDTVFGWSSRNLTEVKATEAAIGVRAGALSIFTDFTQEFDSRDAAFATARSAPLVVSWEPWDSSIANRVQPDFSLGSIAAGDHDEYVNRYLTDVKNSGVDVIIRFAGEVNGDWNAWSQPIAGNSSSDFVAAFRHLVKAGRDLNVQNVSWMFNSIVSYEGSTPLSELYPGDSFVDWVGLDGYNWGSLKWGWQSFEDIFTMGLAEIKSVAPDKPLIIAEIGSTTGPDQAAWIRDTLASSKAAGAKMVLWFDHNKETDWRIGADPVIAAAVNDVVTSAGWRTGK